MLKSFYRMAKPYLDRMLLAFYEVEVKEDAEIDTGRRRPRRPMLGVR